MPLVIHKDFKINEKEVQNFLNTFDSTGKILANGKRNTIKLFELDGKTINIKSFKIPHLINKIAYKYFRKSKARRSFEYATTLIEKGIGTPQPIAYFEKYDAVGLTNSYYASEHLHYDLTFRELVEIPNFPDHSTILRQFTQFSFDLHQKGIEFLDHSPGNTLIKKNNDGKYDFFLVDLNRMAFHDKMNFDRRMKNLSRLTPKKEMIATMSAEYSKLYSAQTQDKIFEKMWAYTSEFQDRLRRKRSIKNKISKK